MSRSSPATMPASRRPGSRIGSSDRPMRWPMEHHQRRGGADRMKQPLIAVSDIPESGTVSADLFGREVLVTIVNGKPRAFINVCMHHGGPLTREGDRFTCGWHGSQFDVRTGKALAG